MSQIVTKDDLKLVQAKTNEIHNILYSLAQRMPPGNPKLKQDLQSFRNNHPDVVRQVASELVEKERKQVEIREALKPKGSKVFSEKWLNEARRIITIHVRLTGRQTFQYKELDQTAHTLGSSLTGKDLFPRAFELAHYKGIIEQVQSHPKALYRVPDEAYKKILGGGSL